MISSVRNAIDWLVEGLIQAWAAVEEQLSPRRRLIMLRTADGYTLQNSDGQGQPVPLPLDLPVADIPAEAAALVKDSDIDIVLPAEELLVRALDPLPAQSKPYLDGIVRHQLERLTPWRANDVLYSYQVAPAATDDSRVIVTMAATTRALHRRRLEQLAALQPRTVRLVYRNALEGKDVAIDVTASGGAPTLRTQQMRRTIGWSAAGLFAFTIVAVMLLTILWQRTDAARETAEQEIIDLHAKRAAKGPVMKPGDRDVAAILERRQNTPYAVIALESLSEALPDDTFLTEFRIAENHVRMSGISRSVSQLVPLLEAAPALAEPTFFAPTTRLPNGDRFHLDARLMPPGTRKP